MGVSKHTGGIQTYGGHPNIQGPSLEVGFATSIYYIYIYIYIYIERERERERQRELNPFWTTDFINGVHPSLPLWEARVGEIGW